MELRFQECIYMCTVSKLCPLPRPVLYPDVRPPRRCSYSEGFTAKLGFIISCRKSSKSSLGRQSTVNSFPPYLANYITVCQNLHSKALVQLTPSLIAA